MECFVVNTDFVTAIKAALISVEIGDVVVSYWNTRCRNPRQGYRGSIKCGDGQIVYLICITGCCI